jgi:hypothetical protein
MELTTTVGANGVLQMAIPLGPEAANCAVRVTIEPEPLTKDAVQVAQEMLAYRDRVKRTLGGLTVREMREEGRRF